VASEGPRLCWGRGKFTCLTFFAGTQKGTPVAPIKNLFKVAYYSFSEEQFCALRNSLSVANFFSRLQYRFCHHREEAENPLQSSL